MSVRIPTRRLGNRALAACKSRPSATARTVCPFSTSASSQKATGKDKELRDPLQDPKILKYLRPSETKTKQKRPETRTGSLSTATSIFQPEYEFPGWEDELPDEEKQRLRKDMEEKDAENKQRREYDLHALRLDPDPAARLAYEKKMIIRDLTRHGRMTKAEKLARTERQSLYKSPLLPTSVKKLTKIMNNIAGKTVEEALVQLRFSQKKVARDVFKGLQLARDEAVAVRGMGLAPDSASSTAEGTTLTKHKFGNTLHADGGEGVVISLKDGSQKRITDPSEIYIDQAYVAKGDAQKSLEFRARGRTNILQHRFTTFSVLLKEEQTRIRLSEERQKKKDNRKVWLPLPDRPITSQRQYCLW